MMKCLLFLGNSVLNFIILNIAVVHNYPQDPNYWIGAGLAFISGLGLAIVKDIRKGNFSIKSCLIKFFTSLFLSFIAIRIKEDFTPGIKIEYFVFICSLCSIYIVDVVEKSIEIGFFKYVQLLLQKGVNIIKLASQESEDAKGGDNL